MSRNSKPLDQRRSRPAIHDLNLLKFTRRICRGRKYAEKIFPKKFQQFAGDGKKIVNNFSPDQKSLKQGGFVFDWEVVREVREGSNPLPYLGHLENILPCLKVLPSTWSYSVLLKIMCKKKIHHNDTKRLSFVVNQILSTQQILQ